VDLFADDPVERILSFMDRVMHPSADPDALRAALRDVREATPCWDGTRLQKSMSGMGPLWGYFPHAMTVNVGGMSIAQKLATPEVRRAVAKKTWAYCQKHERGMVSFNRIRQSIKAYCGHHVSNFRPVAARDIYQRCEAKVVFDPCAGWGGRLLGATAARAEYIGVDASQLTVQGLHRMAQDLGTSATLVFGAIEDGSPIRAEADVAFTSPPYFDTEQYSADPQQSWMRYRTYGAWRDGFLAPLVYRMAVAVRSGGVVAINIADVRGLPLVDDTRHIAKDLGLIPQPDWHYVLSSIAGKGEKIEPILVYRT
jgi:hypothetical protein